MVTRRRPPSSAVQATQSIVQRYQLLLTDNLAVRQGFARKEMSGDFPYSYVNEAAVFLDQAPQLFRSLYGLWARGILPQADGEWDQFGTAGRMYRYLPVALLGASIDSDIPLHEKIMCAAHLCQATWLRVCNLGIGGPREEALASLERSMLADASASQSLLASQVAALLLEYVDYLFLGERALGTEVFWVKSTATAGSVLIRRYHRLSEYVGGEVSTVDIADWFGPEIEIGEVSLFRQKVLALPPYQQKSASVVWINGRPSDWGLAEFSRWVQANMRRRRQQYAGATTDTLEELRARIFAYEVEKVAVEHHAVLPVGPTVATSSGSLATRLREQYQRTLYSETYLDALGECLRFFARELT